MRFGVANQKLVRRARALLHEDLIAEQTFRQLAHDLNDRTTDVVFGLLARETRERCEMMQRIIEGTLDDLASDVRVGALPTDSVRLQAVCLDIQERRAVAADMRNSCVTWRAPSADVVTPRLVQSSTPWPETATNTAVCCWGSRVI
jgi:hypothetical protein